MYMYVSCILLDAFQDLRSYMLLQRGTHTWKFSPTNDLLASTLFAISVSHANVEKKNIEEKCYFFVESTIKRKCLTVRDNTHTHTAIPFDIPKKIVQFFFFLSLMLSHEMERKTTQQQQNKQVKKTSIFNKLLC